MIGNKYYAPRKLPEIFSIRLHNALLKTGHYTVAVDGIFGSRTLKAVRGYQQDNNIAVGQITIETLNKLGIE